MFHLSSLLDRNEYTELGIKYKPINLGQGFSDGPVPQYIIDALAATLNNPNYLLNQYTRGFVSNLLPNHSLIRTKLQ